MTVPRTVVSLLAIFVWVASLAAQSTGEITGRVTDPTGAAIARAELRLTNPATGVAVSGIANDEGIYRFSSLNPASYVLLAHKQGLADTHLTGITVEVNRVSRADVQLQLASTQQELNVVACSQLLDLDSSSKGQIITSEQLRDLPLETRNPLALMTLAPGVTAPNGGRSFNRQGSDGTGLSANFSINGGTKTGSGGYQEYVVDGISATNQRDGTISALPSADSIQEFRVQSGGVSADFGRTVGGAVSYVTHGGSNDLHGNLFEFHRDTTTNARIAIPATSPKPPNVYNQYGGTIGGPVLLPKIYNGKNRTFFFFGYDASRWVRKNPQLATIPTALMRQGNFSELSTPIYDPDTSTAAANRQPFPGNIIPASRFNPIGKHIVDLFPDPTSPGLASNVQGVFRVYTPVTNYTGRIDQVINDRQRLMFRVTWVDSVSDQGWPLGVVDAQTSVISFPSRNMTVNYSNTFTPSLLYSFAAGYTGFHRTLSDPSGNQVGAAFFGYTVSPVNQAAFSNVRPTATFDIYRGLGTGNAQNQVARNWQMNHSLSWVKGKHTVRFGADLRRYFAGGLLTGGPSNGSLGFNALQTSRGTATTGNSVASALLGLANSATFSQPPELNLHKNVAALFVQDDWKVMSNLTLNLGVRWDGEGPLSEEDNKVGFFDPTSINPLVNRPGVFRYAGLNGAPRSIVSSSYINLSPRVGFSYTPLRNKKTVIRGAFAKFNAPLPTAGYYAAAPGFEPSLQFVSPGGGGAALVLGNSYTLPAASGPIGAAAYLGQSFTQPLNRSLSVPEIYQWNFGLQHEIARNTVLEAVYTGNRGNHLLGTQPVNLVPYSLIQQAMNLTTSSGSPNAAFNYLSERVPNPLAGLVPGTLGAASITRAQATAPFPQYSGISSWTNGQDSIYHALQISLQKRLSGDLSFLFSYTFSKQIENVAADASGSIGNNVGAIQNPYNSRDSRAVGSFDHTHNFAGNVLYALPFGTGKHFLHSGVLGRVVGGFQLTAIVMLNTGVPLAITQSGTNGLGVGSARPDVVGNPQPAAQAVRGKVADNGNVVWFDPASFAIANGHFGSEPIRDAHLRGPGFQEVDLGIQRDFRFTERISLRFRAEAFNAFNHTNLSTPGQNISAADFGQVSASFDPRIVQVGLELRF